MERFVVIEAVTYMNLNDNAAREKKQRTFLYILVK